MDTESGTLMQEPTSGPAEGRGRLSWELFQPLQSLCPGWSWILRTGGICWGWGEGVEVGCAGRKLGDGRLPGHSLRAAL